MKTRAKFTLTAIKQEDGSLNVTGHAVTSGSEENKSFATATPGGNLAIHISAGTPAQETFKEGTAEYYLDIEQAPGE